MEIKQLKYFLETARSGSLSKASAVLGVAQPALGRQIRQLEEDVGAQLFYRNGRGVVLTSEGSQFRLKVEPLMHELHQARSDCLAHCKVPAGEISVGLPPGLADAIGAAVVGAFIERFPQVKLRLVEGFTGFMNEMLHAGRLDMAVVSRAQRTPTIHADPLLTLDLFMLAHRDLAKPEDIDSDTIPFDHLCDYPLILMSRHHGLRREIENAATERERHLNVIAEIDGLNCIKNLVRAKAGATVLAKNLFLTREDQDSALIVRPIVEPELTVQLDVAYSSQGPTTLATHEFTKLLRAEVRQATDQGLL